MREKTIGSGRQSSVLFTCWISKGEREWRSNRRSHKASNFVRTA